MILMQSCHPTASSSSVPFDGMKREYELETQSTAGTLPRFAFLVRAVTQSSESTRSAQLWIANLPYANVVGIRVNQTVHWHHRSAAWETRSKRRASRISSSRIGKEDKCTISLQWFATLLFWESFGGRLEHL